MSFIKQEQQLNCSEHRNQMQSPMFPAQPRVSSERGLEIQRDKSFLGAVDNALDKEREDLINKEIFFGLKKFKEMPSSNITDPKLNLEIEALRNEILGKNHLPLIQPQVYLVPVSCPIQTFQPVINIFPIPQVPYLQNFGLLRPQFCNQDRLFHGEFFKNMEERTPSQNEEQDRKMEGMKISAIPQYNHAERAAKIKKYKAKIRKWKEEHKPSRIYSGRKKIASEKPRLKGKFIKKDDIEIAGREANTRKDLVKELPQ